jgi:hypothetical protein
MESYSPEDKHEAIVIASKVIATQRKVGRVEVTAREVLKYGYVMSQNPSKAGEVDRLLSIAVECGIMGLTKVVKENTAYYSYTQAIVEEPARKGHQRTYDSNARNTLRTLERRIK